MENCPTCKAKYRGENICPRCGSDLSPLIRIEKQAQFYRDRAKELMQERNFSEASKSLKLARFLHQPSESEALEACILAFLEDPTNPSST